VVGLRIDPGDWEPYVTADHVVQKTIDRAMDTNPETRGQVILLHDSGGDRQATIDALPRIIHELRARGFQFVPVSTLGGWSRDQVMPLLPPSQSVYTRTDALAFLFLSTGGWLLQWAFIIGIVLGLGRLGVIWRVLCAMVCAQTTAKRKHSANSTTVCFDHRACL